MERKLAHVERIISLSPIPGADRIEVAQVLGWQVVVKKGEFRENDAIVYIEVDSRVPDIEYFDFLRERNFKVKSIKLRKQISQGLIVPMSLLHDKFSYNIGEDVSGELGITKIQEDYEPPKVDPIVQLKQRHKKLYKNAAFQWFMKYAWFRKLVFKLLIPKKKKNGWPAWVVKTDEERIQNMPSILQDKNFFEVAEKMDGTSSTFTLRRVGKKFEFMVCSRNVVQATPDRKCFYDSNVYWEMAQKYEIENVLKLLIKDNEWITLQGETIGPDIQKNKYELKERELRCFNLITEKEGKLTSTEAIARLEGTKLQWVPVIDTQYILPDTIDELMAYSTGNSVLHDTLREGYVFRNYEKGISFKCVSNEFLLKWGI